MKKYFPIAGLAITIIAFSYLQSPYSLINKDYVQMTTVPNEVFLAEARGGMEAEEEKQETEEAASTENSGEDKEIAPQNYTLELVLEERTKVDGFIEETYHEYEIYRDKSGQVIKKIPTAHYSYLRYYDH
nr:hypothetical protein [uncultured Bacillus sp.]